MVPARHETGPSQLDGADDKTPYGTRASKRKASEISTGPPFPHPASPPSKSSTRAAKSKVGAKKTVTATESEPHQSPSKKRRASPEFEPELPNSSSSANQNSEAPVVEDNSGPSSIRNSSQPNVDVPEPVSASATPGPEQDASASDQPIPEVQVDGPSGSNEDDLDADAEGDDDDEIPTPGEEALEPPNGLPETTRGRGRGRGRGGRGFRGTSRGRGGRGGRVKAGAGARGAKSAVPSTRGRGRGRGGRRKKVENHRIDVTLKRKLELKAQFKMISAIQRTALSQLADKSLEMLQKDPLYHESLPEFKTVTNKLRQTYDENQARFDKFVENEVALANRNREYNEYLIEQQFRLQVEEIEENYNARIMEYTAYVYAKANAPKGESATLEDIPFGKGEDGRLVKESFLPPKKVHAAGMPFMNPPTAVSNVRSTAGDNDYEQHPANWWQAKSKKEKAAILKKQSECVAENQRPAGGRKKGGRQALFSAQQEIAEGGEGAEAVEGEEDAEEQPDESPSRPQSSGPSRDPSRPPTSDGSAPPDDEPVASDDIEDSDAAPHGPDAWLTSIPRKKVRRDQPAAFNRIVAPTPVHFEKHEIGFARTHYQKQPDGSLKKLGRDASPNPDSSMVYFEQRQGRHNAGKNKEEDLDQKIVKAHKLHPRLGLPLPISRNPDRNQLKRPYFKEGTDWNADLQPTNPVMFVHQNGDGSRTISRTSRSEWLGRAEREFNQIPVAKKMANLLAASGYLYSRPATPVTPEPPQFIAKDLVDAIEIAAETQKEDEKRAADEARIQASRPAQPQMFSPNHPPRTPMFTSPSAKGYSPPSGYQPQQQNAGFSPRQPMPPPPPARTGYDPVRDIYVTPYAQPQHRAAPPPPQPQVPHATYSNGGGNLSELADAAWHYGGGTNPNEYQHNNNMPPPPQAQPPAQPPAQSSTYQPGNPLSAPPGHFQTYDQLQRSNPNIPPPMMAGMGPGMGVFGPQAMYHASPYGPPPPAPQQQQQSPRSAGPGGSRRAARELRPAPPASRALQPQQPPQNPQQYRGYGGSGSYQ